MTRWGLIVLVALLLGGVAMFPGPVLETSDAIRLAWLRRQYTARFTTCLRDHNLPTGPEKPHTAYELRQRTLCQGWALDDTYGRKVTR